jgi:Zn-finger nucleic acid-binding protein
MCFFKKNNQDKQKEIPLRCPRCNKFMNKLKKSDIIIDICPKCRGMWLDDKEVDKLIQMREENKNGKKSAKKRK